MNQNQPSQRSSSNQKQPPPVVPRKQQQQRNIITVNDQTKSNCNSPSSSTAPLPPPVPKRPTVLSPPERHVLVPQPVPRQQSNQAVNHLRNQHVSSISVDKKLIKMTIDSDNNNSSAPPIPLRPPAIKPRPPLSSHQHSHRHSLPNNVTSLSSSSSSSLLPNNTTIQSENNYSANQIAYPSREFVNRRQPSHHSTLNLSATNTVTCLVGTRLFLVQSSQSHQGLIKSIDIKTNKLLESIKCFDCKITALSFCRFDGYLWIGTGEGHLMIADISSDNVIYKKFHVFDLSTTNSSSSSQRQQSSNNSIKKILFTNQNEVVIVAENGSLLHWQFNWTKSSNNSIFAVEFNFSSKNHNNNNNISRIMNRPMFIEVSGNILVVAVSKFIQIFNLTNHETIAKTMITKFESIHQISITGLALLENQQKILISLDNGNIFILDYNLNLICTLSLGAYKITGMFVSNYNFDIWVSFSIGKIAIIDTKNFNFTVKKEWKVISESITDIFLGHPSLQPENNISFENEGNEHFALSISQSGVTIAWNVNDIDETFKLQRSVNPLNCPLTIQICSWNVDSQTPNDHLHPFFTEWFSLLQSQQLPDLISINLQEIVNLESKSNNAKGIILNKENEMKGKLWISQFNRVLLPNNYKLISSEQMMGLFSCIYVKNELISDFSDIATCTIKTGLGGLHGNKGSIVTRLLYKQNISLCFLDCHLAAGQAETMQRNIDCANILKAVDILPPSNFSFPNGGDGCQILDYDHVFFIGDLNYRINLKREEIIKCINLQEYSKLLQNDQLHSQRIKKQPFPLEYFKELLPISFPPTYKYDRHSNSFDSSGKQRAPAWCDRILYKSTGNIEGCNYKRHEVNTSDHRPISASFIIK